MESLTQFYSWVISHHMVWIGVFVFLAILVLPEILVKPNVLETTLKRGDGKSESED